MDDQVVWMSEPDIFGERIEVARFDQHGATIRIRNADGKPLHFMVLNSVETRAMAEALVPTEPQR